MLIRAIYFSVPHIILVGVVCVVQYLAMCYVLYLLYINSYLEVQYVIHLLFGKLRGIYGSRLKKRSSDVNSQ